MDQESLRLRANHSKDLTIYMQLEKLVMEKGIAFGCCAAPRRLEALVSDVHTGPFLHDGPETYDEALQEDRRPIPGVKEGEVKAWLDEELGIKTSGYKSYYTQLWISKK